MSQKKCSVCREPGCNRGRHQVPVDVPQLGEPTTGDLLEALQGAVDRARADRPAPAGPDRAREALREAALGRAGGEHAARLQAAELAADQQADRDRILATDPDPHIEGCECPVCEAADCRCLGGLPTELHVQGAAGCMYSPLGLDESHYFGPGEQADIIATAKIRPDLLEHVRAEDDVAQESAAEAQAAANECTCVPCETPAFGAPGIAHCAACCAGSGIEEYDHDCPIEGHRVLAVQQFGERLVEDEDGAPLPPDQQPGPAETEQEVLRVALQAQAQQQVPVVGDFPEGFRAHFALDHMRAEDGSGEFRPPAARGYWPETWAPWRTPEGPRGPLLITLPGVYDLTAEQYHDPSITGDWLSNSDARQLIAPGCPAKFRYNRDHGVRKTSDAFDLGHAVHTRVLGKGEQIVVRPAEWDSWRTKASQAWRAEQHAAGRTVILPDQEAIIEAMAAAVRDNDDARALLDQPGGRAEACLFWIDEETGVKRRAMVDLLADRPVDLKTAQSACPGFDMDKKIYTFAYHRQAVTILDGIETLNLPYDGEFNFIYVETEAPHVVQVVKLDDIAQKVGRDDNRSAIELYARCLETNTWPGYADGPVYASVPAYIARDHIEEMEIG